MLRVLLIAFVVSCGTDLPKCKDLDCTMGESEEEPPLYCPDGPDEPCFCVSQAHEDQWCEP